MATRRREHDGGVVAFHSDEAGIGFKLLPQARTSSNLTLTREERRHKGSGEHGHGELDLGGAISVRGDIVAQGPTPWFERRC